MVNHIASFAEQGFEWTDLVDLSLEELKNLPVNKRVLTILSVFFMPLTFIVGVYGMNFDVMPELHWKIGYPGVMGLMVVVTISIYFWFKRKAWL